MPDLSDLIKISRLYGRDKQFVIAGGGNTSWKDDTHLYVKASGTSLADISAEDFAVLDRLKLSGLLHGHYSQDPFRREEEIKLGLMNACVQTGRNLRPSVEASLHEMLNYKFVVHMHPTLLNGILCSKNAEKNSSKLFPEALFVRITDPGFVLSKKVDELLKEYRGQFSRDPSMILLQNHGVFIGADTIFGVRKICDHTLKIISRHLKSRPDLKAIGPDARASKILPALRMMLSENGLKVLALRNNGLIQFYSRNDRNFSAVSAPFTPDQIVYCKSQYLYFDEDDTAALVEKMAAAVKKFTKQNGYTPKVIFIKGLGLVGSDDSATGAETVLDMFEDSLKIAWVAENFGGPQPMARKAVQFIDTWEVENYRRKVAKVGSLGKLQGRIVIVTGAAQGFGEGIARDIFDNGANTVIADLNPEKGRNLEKELNGRKCANRAFFIHSDVSSAMSVKNLVRQTVEHFGGLDVIISNAGILRAGGLDEMEPATFALMTKVNYEGYFFCAKYASEVMRLQHEWMKGHFMDIIQINSKSGLQGSDRNFAYAGGKFGGVGLTQSFAKELMAYQIKVNSICPGNFFDGPLWADPQTGLFAQYLKAGKVPGAKNISDIRKFYENKIPAGRGCCVKDVMRAVYYVIEQEYETGQAIPVTGGQVMLN